MTQPQPSGSRTAAPLPPPAPLTPFPALPAVPRRSAAPAPSTAVLPTTQPHPGDPGFIGATTHDGRAPDERRRRRAPLGWLPWAALVALLVLLLLAGLAASLVGNGPEHTKATAAAITKTVRLSS